MPNNTTSVATLAVALLLPQVALAQGFDAESFRPATSSTSTFSQDNAQMLSAGALAAGLTLGYALRPLVLRDAAGNERTADLISDRLGAHLTAGFGIAGRLEIGLRIPVVLFQDGDSTAASANGLASTTFGDIDVAAKVALIGRARQPGFRLAFAVTMALPSGSVENFSGDTSVALRPRLIAGYHASRFSATASAGYNLRDKVTAPGSSLIIDDEIAAGLAATYETIPGRMWLMGEAFMAAGVNGGGAGERAVPAEALAGARYLLADRWFVQAAAGSGLTQGVGAPRFRAIAALGFASDLLVPRPAAPPPPPPSPVDTDGDGLLDPVDKCPTDPEDKDGFEDEDGCPEPDNDKDGILDAADKCPNDPEDKDGFEDEDGCPEPDNDKDGILDATDKCPNEPEDKDGFEDEDGCPDPDNDGDGFLDAADKCPNEPEVVNGNADDDGCPDEGLVVLTREKIEIKEQVHFDFNRARIRKISFPLLAAVANILALHPEITKIRIEGHTDDVGSDKFNQKLSEKRAQAVMQHLIKKNGIAKERLESVGHGRTKPLSDLKTDVARAANRRVEFIVVVRAIP